MSKIPSDIKERMAKIIRLLSSEHEGEVLAAVHALRRSLEANGISINDLAAEFEAGDVNKLSHSDMQTLYDAGYSAGLEAGKRQSSSVPATVKNGGDDPFSTVGAEDGLTVTEDDWHPMAVYCYDRIYRLAGNHHEFITDMGYKANLAAKGRGYRHPTERQMNYLRSLFRQLGGRIQGW